MVVLGGLGHGISPLAVISDGRGKEEAGGGGGS